MLGESSALVHYHEGFLVLYSFFITCVELTVVNRIIFTWIYIYKSPVISSAVSVLKKLVSRLSR